MKVISSIKEKIAPEKSKTLNLDEFKYIPNTPSWILQSLIKAAELKKVY